MPCVLASDQKLRRCALLKDPHGMPRQTEVRQQLGAALAEVFFTTVPPRAREMLGLIPVLKGIDEDPEISPSEIMISKIIKLQATRKKGRSSVMGQQNRKSLEEVQMENKLLIFEFSFAIQDAVFHTRVKAEANHEREKAHLLKRCQHLMNYNIVKCQREMTHAMLRRVQVERREVEILFRSQMAWRLRQQQQQLTEQFRRDHLIGMKELEFQFRAFLESQRNECCRLLSLEATKYEQCMQRQYCRWQARTRAEIAWAVCEERKKCAEEKRAMEEAFQRRIDELMVLYEDGAGEMSQLSNLCNSLKEDILLWQKRVIEILYAFQKLINCMTDSPTDQCQYLLDIGRLLTIHAPLPDAEEPESPVPSISSLEQTLEHSLVTLPPVIQPEEIIPEVLLRESSSDFHLALVEPILYELIRTLPIGYEYAPYCNVIKRYTDNYFFEDNKNIIPDKLSLPTTYPSVFIFHPQGYCDCHIRFGALYYNMDPSKCILAQVASEAITDEAIEAKHVEKLERGLEAVMKQRKRDELGLVEEEEVVEKDESGEEELEDKHLIGEETEEEEEGDDGKGKGKHKKKGKGKGKGKDKDKKKGKDKDKDKDKNKDKGKDKDKDKDKGKGKGEEKGKERKKKGKGKKKHKKGGGKGSDEESEQSSTGLTHSMTFSQTSEGLDKEEGREQDGDETGQGKFRGSGFGSGSRGWLCDKADVINNVCTACGTVIKDHCEACADKLQKYGEFLKKSRQPKLDESGTMLVCCECDSLIDLVCPGCSAPLGKIESWQGPSVADVQAFFETSNVQKKSKQSSASLIFHQQQQESTQKRKPKKSATRTKKEKPSLSAKKERMLEKGEMEEKSKSRDRLSIILEIMRENPSLKHTIIPYTGIGV